MSKIPLESLTAMTPTSGVILDGYGGCYYKRLGNKVLVNVALELTAPHTAYDEIMRIEDPDCRPKQTVVFAIDGGSSSASVNLANLVIYSNGRIRIITGDDKYAIGNMQYSLLA